MSEKDLNLDDWDNLPLDPSQDDWDDIPPPDEGAGRPDASGDEPPAPSADESFDLSTPSADEASDPSAPDEEAVDPADEAAGSIAPPAEDAPESSGAPPAVEDAFDSLEAPPDEEAPADGASDPMEPPMDMDEPPAEDEAVTETPPEADSGGSSEAGSEPSPEDGDGFDSHDDDFDASHHDEDFDGPLPAADGDLPSEGGEGDEPAPEAPDESAPQEAPPAEAGPEGEDHHDLTSPKKVELDLEGIFSEEDVNQAAPDNEPAPAPQQEAPPAEAAEEPADIEVEMVRRKIPKIKLLLIVVPAVLLVAGLGFGAWFLLFSGPEPLPAPPPLIIDPNLPPRDPRPGEMRLETFLINFPGRPKDTIVEVSMVLHYEDSVNAKVITEGLTVVRDVIYRTTQNKGSQMITSAEVQRELREELRERANAALGGAHVSYVQITQIRILH